MSSFPELRHGQFVRFLEAFCRTGTLKFRNKKYLPPLVEAVAKDLGVSREEFWKWYSE